MKQGKSLIAALALLPLPLLGQTTDATESRKFEFGTAVSLRGGRTFEVDRYGVLLDGEHVIPVMGEIHYTRVPQKEWRREIRKMKAGGITVIATYVFWIHHEPEEGKWDWSGNRDLRRFVEICAEEGMMLVLRVGPFCHGEVYQGGFPVWLTEKSRQDPKNFRMRSEAPGFIEATRRLYANISAQVNGLQWKDGGPIVGMQIENECRGPWSYFKRLKRMAEEVGFDVPMYTRTGWPKLNGKEEFGQILPLYGDYADGFWDRSMKDMPGEYPKSFIMKDTRLSSVIATESLGKDQSTKMESSDLSYPYFTCELGGGMMPAYHRRINISGGELKPLAVCKLGSGSNLPGYYMYHGGTNPYNPAQTMGETQASHVTNYNDMPYMTYDFQAPLGEMGQPLDRSFHEGRLLHQMLADWGDVLCTMEVDTLSEHYARRGAFEFYNDYVRILNEEGQAYVTPRGLKVGEHCTIDYAMAEPFCLVGDTVYLVEIEGKKPTLSVNGKRCSVKLNRPVKAGGKVFSILSKKQALTAFKVDGNLLYAPHGGIVYKADSLLVEEYWQTDNTLKTVATQTAEAQAPRKVELGAQKVAAMPVNEDFERAAVWTLTLPETGDRPVDDLFLRIRYKGDVARVYADGRLVEDNFWNGKPMLVRLSDLVGKRVELRILPLSKEYPIYLQQAEREALDNAPEGILLTLDGIETLVRHTDTIGKALKK